MISKATTLLERIEHGAQGELGITFIDGDDAETVSYAHLYEMAKSSAALLQDLGVGPNSRVGVLAPTTKSLVIAMQAVWLTGATLVMLPLPMRLGSIDEFVSQTRRRIAGSDIGLVIGDEQLTAFIEPHPDDAPMVGLGEIVVGSAHDYVRPEPDPDAVAILQFTSGSTADPKGVVLSNRAITANLDAVILATGLTPGFDVMVSWLPLYHDMGLVGFLVLPMTSGVDLVLGAPQDFLAKPVRWMEWLSTYGGTATAGPNFSWVLAARALKRSETLDLSNLRVGLNGAEPVDPTAVQNFIDAGAAHGMRPGAVYPAFGMAEVVIGATMPPPMRGLVLDHVDRASLESERFAQPGDPAAKTTRTLVKLGPAIDGFEMRIVDVDSRQAVADRFVGELQFRGPSVCSGYYNRPDATEAMFDGDWLCTGDLGYIADGDLVLCGRIKDIIIVAGRNVFPDEIERAVGEVEGVRAGNVVAFGIDGRHGKQEVVVLAEARTNGDGIDAAEGVIDLRRGVSSRVKGAVGLPAKDIVFLEPGTLPKTSSGKLQRSKARELFLAGEFNSA